MATPDTITPTQLSRLIGECVGVESFVYGFQMIVMLHAEHEWVFPMIQDDCVPIDPTLLDVLYIVVHNEFFTGRN